MYKKFQLVQVKNTKRINLFSDADIIKKQEKFW